MLMFVEILHTHTHTHTHPSYWKAMALAMDRSIASSHALWGDLLSACFPGGAVAKNLPANAKNVSIPGSGRSPGGGHGNPLQYPCLENPMERGAWRAAVHSVAKSWTGLSHWAPPPLPQHEMGREKWILSGCLESLIGRAPTFCLPLFSNLLIQAPKLQFWLTF